MVFAVIALALVGGCASKPGYTMLDGKYVGTWVNVIPDNYNWWVLEQGSATNYGIALKQGRCGRYTATLLGRKKILVIFGNAATVNLKIRHDRLVFSSNKGVAVHERSTPEAICRRADGTYFEGAPFQVGRD